MEFTRRKKNITGEFSRTFLFQVVHRRTNGRTDHEEKRKNHLKIIDSGPALGEGERERRSHSAEHAEWGEGKEMHCFLFLPFSRLW